MNLLDLPSLIRINQLIRGTIDADGFETWWRKAARSERETLTCTLYFCAREAGIKAPMVDEALRISKLSGDDDSLRQAVTAARGTFLDAAVFYDWIAKASDPSLHKAFRFGYHLFGLAEGAVFRNESSEWCNHWWHRDLKDPRVVTDILSDPRYYQTSMATDQKFKQAVPWWKRFFNW
jgi:hypothetical protein